MEKEHHSEDPRSRVLLLLQSPVMADAFKLLLEQDNRFVVVDCAADGNEGVRLFTELRPDVLVLDLLLPGANAVDVLSGFTANGIQCRSVVMALDQSWVTNQEIIRVVRAGALALVVRESSGYDLLQAVAAAAAGELYLGNRVLDRVLEQILALSDGTTDHDPLSVLSGRERQVIKMVAEGRANRAIADDLSLSPHSVSTYRSRAMKKLRILTYPELVLFAIRHGLVSLEP